MYRAYYTNYLPNSLYYAAIHYYALNDSLCSSDYTVCVYAMCINNYYNATYRTHF